MANGDLERNGVPAGRTIEVVTNAIKLGGLVIAINEALIRTELRPAGLAVAGFMMAGAQGIESFLNAFFARK